MCEKKSTEWLKNSEWGDAHVHVGFVTWARDYVATAGLIPTDKENGKHFFRLGHTLSGYYLLFHAIELGLKSYLIQHGYTQAKLKKMGHNLRDILAAADRCGIDQSFITQILRDAIVCWNEQYMNKEFEYRIKLGFMVRQHCVATIQHDIKRLLDSLWDRYRLDARAETAKKSE